MKNKPVFKLVILSFFILQSAYAEERLFPTDILQKGEVDLALSATNYRVHGSVTALGTITGNRHIDQTTETAEIRYGLGHNLHIGAAFDHNSSYEYKEDYSNGQSFLSTKYSGQQNPAFWIKYGFLDDKQSEYKLTAEFLVSPNTTGKNPSYYSAIITGSKDFRNNLKLYTQYSGTFVADHSSLPTEHAISLGAFKKINENLTVMPSIFYSRDEATDSITASNRYGVSISTLYQVAHNTYLGAGVGFSQRSSFDTKNGIFSYDKTNQTGLMARIYRLF